MKLWTPHMMECLRGLAEKGLPPADIANQMGLTKNAVIGKAWREGIKLTPNREGWGGRRRGPNMIAAGE